MEEHREAEGKLIEGIFDTLWEITRSFRFSKETCAKEKEEALDDELRASRLRELITATRKEGIRSFYRMPKEIQQSFSREDWIQEAILILLIQSQKYIPREGYYYNDYMQCFKVRNGLKSLQSKLLRQYGSWEAGPRVQLATDPDAVEPPSSAGGNVDGAQAGKRDEEVPPSRSGPRILFQPMHGGREADDDKEELDPASPDPSPEEVCLSEEFRRILLQCISELDKRCRLVMTGIMEGKTQAEIHRATMLTIDTVRNLYRKAMRSLRDCVLNRYRMHSADMRSR